MGHTFDMIVAGDDGESILRLTNDNARERNE